MKTTFAWFMCLCVMCSCNNASQKKNESAETNASATETTVKKTGINGLYEGTLPAADCPGIKTSLTINSDQTYQLKSEYIDEKDGIFETNGVYQLIGDSIIELITPSSGEKTYYRILNDEQVMLSDAKGTVNKGELSEYYILKKKK